MLCFVVLFVGVVCQNRVIMVVVYRFSMEVFMVWKGCSCLMLNPRYVAVCIHSSPYLVSTNLYRISHNMMKISSNVDIVTGYLEGSHWKTIGRGLTSPPLNPALSWHMKASPKSTKTKPARPKQSAAMKPTGWGARARQSLFNLWSKSRSSATTSPNQSQVET